MFKRITISAEGSAIHVATVFADRIEESEMQNGKIIKAFTRDILIAIIYTDMGTTVEITEHSLTEAA